MHSLTQSFVTLILVLCQTVFLSMASAQNSKSLPLFEFSSLRYNEVNLRAGPGVRYPIEWVFHRKALPVRIIRKYATWRLIRDWEGDQGWVHQSLLTKARTFIVLGKLRTLRHRPESESAAVAQLEGGVIGQLEFCPSNNGWCRVTTKGYSGWLRRAEIWGIGINEVIK